METSPGNSEERGEEENMRNTEQGLTFIAQSGRELQAGTQKWCHWTHKHPSV